MRFLDLDRLVSVTELLALLFYALMAVALLAVLVGVPGTGLLLLLLGAAVHVVRFSLELFADGQSPRGA
ncbi:MAG TPA: hypothetical protein VLL27_08650 [Solirubrobacterales bacterium]|nr:hypothetical protein [Solirubrobacterales bacterium]